MTAPTFAQAQSNSTHTAGGTPEGRPRVTTHHPVKGNEQTRSRSAADKCDHQQVDSLHQGRMGAKCNSGSRTSKEVGKQRQQPEVRTRPRIGWENRGQGLVCGGSTNRHGGGAQAGQVGRAGEAGVTGEYRLQGGAGQAGHQRGRREYLGVSPPPGLWTPVLPAHLLPPRVRTLSIYQKAREKCHVT